MEDLDDHAGAVEHLHPGGSLEVARLTGPELVIDGDELRPLLAVLGDIFADDRHLAGVVVEVVELDLVVALAALVLAALAGLVLARGHGGGHVAAAAGELGQLLELALAEHHGLAEHLAALGHRRGDVVAEGVDEAGELGEVGGVLRVADAGQLNADEDRGGPVGRSFGHRGRQTDAPDRRRQVRRGASGPCQRGWRGGSGGSAVSMSTAWTISSAPTACSIPP
nr:hypothetical protein [Nannocystis pusilla]